MDFKKLSKIADSVVNYTSDLDNYFEGKAGKTSEVFPEGVDEDMSEVFGPVKPWCFTFEGNADFDVQFFDTEEEMNEFIKNHYDEPYPDEPSPIKGNQIQSDVELLKNVYNDAHFVSYDYDYDLYKVKFNAPSEKELEDKLKEAGERVPEGYKVDTTEDPRIYRWGNGTYDGNLWLKKPKSKK